MKNEKTVILVDGKTDVEDLRESMQDIQNAEIICFDFYAHKALKELGIAHYIIEEFFSENDENIIDSLTVEYATNWYSNEKISKYIEYKMLNLGFLLETELVSHIFYFLKRILGMIRILEKNNPSTIVVSSLQDFVKLISNKNIEIISLSKNESKRKISEDYKIPFNIGSKTKTIKISRKNYSYIKKFFEVVTNLIFDLKYVHKKNRHGKSILLLDFNPVLYPDLIKELSSIPKNILLLNQRRPAIWNLESLHIIRNSRCKIVELRDFKEKDISRQINKDIDKMKENLTNFWKNDYELESYFIIEGISFWKIIKSEFKEIMEARSEKAIQDYLLLEKFLEQNNIDSILEWADTGFEEKITTHLARELKIPIFMLQHGTAPLNEKWDKYHKLIPYFPSSGVKAMVWGTEMENYIFEKGIIKEKVLSVGSPRHDKFFAERKKIRNNHIILIAANGVLEYSFAGNDIRTFDYLENYVNELYKIIKKISKQKIIVKLHPGQFYYDIKPLIQKMDNSISIIQNQNIIESIKSCDVMISLNYSTALLDAMILRKPTMVVLPEKQGFENENMITKKATLYEPDIKNIESSLEKLLHDEKFRQKLIDNGSKFVDDYLVFQGKSSKEIAKKLAL